MIATLDYYRPVQGLKIAIQEYGVSKPEMIEDLKKRGANVFSVPVYRWALPEDTGPLEAAVGEVLNGTIDAMMITNAAQIDHVMNGILPRLPAIAQPVFSTSVRQAATSGIK